MTNLDPSSWQAATIFIQNNWALFVAISLWSLVWKGLALWRAAQLRQMYWFIAMLFLNTIGILEIIYFFFIAPRRVKALDR